MSRKNTEVADFDLDRSNLPSSRFLVFFILFSLTVVSFILSSGIGGILPKMIPAPLFISSFLGITWRESIRLQDRFEKYELKTASRVLTGLTFTVGVVTVLMPVVPSLGTWTNMNALTLAIGFVSGASLDFTSKFLTGLGEYLLVAPRKLWNSLTK